MSDRLADRLNLNIKSYKYLKYTAFTALFKKKKRINFFKTQYVCVKTLQLEKASERFRRQFRLVVFPKINNKKFEGRLIVFIFPLLRTKAQFIRGSSAMPT